MFTLKSKYFIKSYQELLLCSLELNHCTSLYQNNYCTLLITNNNFTKQHWHYQAGNLEPLLNSLKGYITLKVKIKLYTSNNSLSVHPNFQLHKSRCCMLWNKTTNKNSNPPRYSNLEQKILSQTTYQCAIVTHSA